MSLISVVLETNEVNEYVSGITAAEVIVDIHGKNMDVLQQESTGFKEIFLMKFLRTAKLRELKLNQMKECIFSDTLVHIF